MVDQIVTDSENGGGLWPAGGESRDAITRCEINVKNVFIPFYSTNI